MSKTEFKIGEEIYLKTDPDQYVRIVTSIVKTPNGFKYELSIADHASLHYECEMTREKQII